MHRFKYTGDFNAMSAYDEFIKNADVRLFASGAGNAPKKELEKVLEQPAEADMSPERMKRLEEMLKKSEIGREAVNFLHTSGIKAGFEKMNYYGYFNPEENRIALNPNFSDEDLALTFVHEMRHVRQNTIMENTSSEMMPETLLKNAFLTEADACAAECVFAHQMKERGVDTVLKAHQKTPYAPLSVAFEKEFNKSHDMDKARNAAFTEWYNLPIRSRYADQYIGLMAHFSVKGNESDFSQEISAEKMAKKLCLNEAGKCYAEALEKLDAKDKICVDDKQAWKMAYVLRPFMKKYDRTPKQLGLDNIAVVKEDGSYSTVRKELDEFYALTAAQAAARKAKGGR